MKKKKGFTLIELLAVIVILAVLALIATPAVLKVINNVRKEAFRQSALNIVNSGIRKCEASNLTNNSKKLFVEYQDGKEVETENTIGSLNGEYKGKKPDSGQVSVHSDCKGSIAVYDDSLKMCAFKYYNDEKVTVVDLKDKSKCIVDSEIKGDSEPIFTGYSCSDPKGTVATAENYFTFDQSTGTITGYSNEGPKDVVIPCKIGGADVKTIGASAFASKELTSVIMPDTVLNIQSSAFKNNKITTLSLGNKVEIIKGGAFYNNNISNLVLPNSLKTISAAASENYMNSGAFAFNNIETIVFGNNLESIGGGAFSQNQLKELILPDSLKTIGSGGKYTYGAFYDNEITKVVFGNSIESIGAEAFYANPIIEVDLSKATKLNSIGVKSFYNNKITSLMLNGTNLNIQSGAFQNNLIEELKIEGTISSITEDAFKNNQLPDSEAFIMKSYANGKSTSSVLTSYAGSNRNNIVLPSNVESVTATFSGLGITGHFDTGDGLISVVDSMFESNSLTSVRIGNNVTSIGIKAFKNNKITTLSLGNKVEIIKGGAFYNNNISNLVLPNSLKTISAAASENYMNSGAFAFNNIETIVFGNNLESIGGGAFSQNQLKELILPDSLKTIGSGGKYTYGAFYDNKITKVEIPASVTTIGASAFESNATLTEIFVRGKKDASGFTSLGSSWNGTCTNIIYEYSSCYTYNGSTITDYLTSCTKNVEIPSELDGVTITTIGDNAFKDKGITRVVIPSTITVIGSNAFSGNSIDPIVVKGKSSESNFTNVGSNWNGSNHVIYENNQDTCFKITDTTVTGYYSNETVCPKVVTVPIGVTKIKDSALANTGITSLTIPKTVTTIGSNILKNNVMDRITVLDGTRLTSVGINWNGTAHKVNFEGDSYEYNCFTVSDGKITKYPSYCSATVNLSSGLVQGQTITSIGANAFKGSGVSYVTLGNTITSIGASAFENNDIISLDLGTSVTTIGNRAFYNTGLIDVVLPSSVKNIGDNVFASNDKLELITVQGKADESGFTSVGTNWYGTCPVVEYTG